MLIDAHSHLDRYDLIDNKALDAALSEVNQHRILTISNSMGVASYGRNLEIGELCDRVIPIFGVHPWNAPEYVDHLEELHDVIKQSPMIGEIGLDYYFIEDPHSYPDQREVFEFFLGVAKEQDKIVNVHTKGAEKDVFELLERYDIPRTIVHWYSGPLDILKKMVERGIYFTVGIEVFHSEHIKTVANEIPLKQLLTETDNPGGPKEFIGGPGMPLLLEDVVRGIADARNDNIDAIIQVVRGNFLDLIKDDPWLTNLYDRVLREQ